MITNQSACGRHWRRILLLALGLGLASRHTSFGQELKMELSRADSTGNNSRDWTRSFRINPPKMKKPVLAFQLADVQSVFEDVVIVQSTMPTVTREPTDADGQNRS
jgi:hypothetical protein